MTTTTTPATEPAPGPANASTTTTTTFPITPQPPMAPSPAPQAPVAVDVPRRPGRFAPDDMAAVIGSLLASLALVWLIFNQLLPWSGRTGFFVGWYVLLIVIYAAVTALHHPRPVVVDRVMSVVVAAAALLVGVALASTVVYVIWHGKGALWHANLFTHDMSGVGPQDPLSKGGILHAIVGTLVEIAIAVSIALPLGLGTAVYMTEVGGRLSIAVRTVVEAMTALPDILSGLFIYTTLIVALGFSRTGFCAAMSLTIMMLPTIARSAEVTLRVVPGGLREAGLALGASQWSTVRRVVLPTARAGLATALILGVARGIGETSPVLITSGASTFLNYDPLHNPMNSLPLFTFVSVRSGEPLYIARGFAAASVLLIVVVLLFGVTRFISRDKQGNR
jgi:phosphate transport system permease protein